MQEVKLTGEHIAKVRDVEDILRGDVREVYRLADRDGASTSNGKLGMDTVGALQDAVIAVFVEEWTLTDSHGKRLPIDMKSVKKVPLRDYTALIKALADVLAEIMTGQSQETPDPTSEDNSSTPDSSDSNE